jgi:hypothetical protein
MLSLSFVTPVHAQSQAERLERFVTRIVENDCQLRRADTEPVFSEPEFSVPAETQMMIFALILSGRAIYDDESIRLFHEDCQGEVFDAMHAVEENGPQDMELVEAYTKALEENGCDLPVTEARTVLSEAGIDDPNMAAQIAAFLRADGRLVALSDPYRMRLVSETCPEG